MNLTIFEATSEFKNSPYLLILVSKPFIALATGAADQNLPILPGYAKSSIRSVLPRHLQLPMKSHGDAGTSPGTAPIGNCQTLRTILKGHQSLRAVRLASSGLSLSK